MTKEELQKAVSYAEEVLEVCRKGMTRLDDNVEPPIELTLRCFLHLAKENEELHAGIDDRIEACIGHLREISRLEEAVKIAVQAIENISHGDENASLQDAALDQINKLINSKSTAPKGALDEAEEYIRQCLEDFHQNVCGTSRGCFCKNSTALDWLSKHGKKR